MNEKTDRELLEAAAKASGRRIGFEPDAWFWSEHGTSGTAMYQARRNSHVSWNPLNDDGDALRLAFALRLNSEFYKVGDTEGVLVEDWDGNEKDEEFGGDGLASWRRAIVRAAAGMDAATAAIARGEGA